MPRVCRGWEGILLPLGSQCHFGSALADLGSDRSSLLTCFGPTLARLPRVYAARCFCFSCDNRERVRDSLPCARASAARARLAHNRAPRRAGEMVLPTTALLGLLAATGGILHGRWPRSPLVPTWSH